MRHLRRGISMVFGDKRFRAYVWKPMAVSAMLFVAIVALGYWLVVPRVQAWLDAQAWMPNVLLGLVGVGYLVVWVFLAGAVYLGIAGFLSSFLWERLSLEIEKSAYGAAPQGNLGCGASVADTILRLPFNLGLALIAVLFGWAFFGAVGVLLAGLIGLSDFTANAYARRGVRFPAQFCRAWRLPGALQFLVLTGAVALIPLLNVFLLPAMVAAGTLFVAEGDPAHPNPPASR